MSRDYESALNIVALAMSACPEALKGLIRERPKLIAEVEKLTAERDALAAKCKELVEALAEIRDMRGAWEERATRMEAIARAALTPRTDGGGAKEE